MIALGIDASVTSTGLVVLEDHVDNLAQPRLLHEEAVRVKSKGFERYSDIAERLLGTLSEFRPNRVAIEGYAGQYKGSMIPNIELGGILRYFLRQSGHQWLEPAPTQLKRFVTGKGNAEKSQMMMHVLKRWGHEAQNDDTADAYGLAAIGLAHLGKLKGLTSGMLEIVGVLPLV